MADPDMQGKSMASTPASLKQQAIEKFVFLVLRHMTPPSLPAIPIPEIDDGALILTSHLKLDRLVTTSEGRWPELLPEKRLLLKHLQKLKQWWDNNEWLGNHASEIRRDIKDCFTIELEWLDPYCRCPLFVMVLQLMFSTRIGVTTGLPDSYPKVQLELHRDCCPMFVEVLESLAPFGIEELSTQPIIFGSVSPWNVIIQNSPHLRKVHFSKNYSEDVLLCVGQSCPRIDTFIVELLIGRELVSVDCLYKTFFSGLDLQAVNALADRGVDRISTEKYLSFPRLKCVDFGIGKQAVSDLINYLLLFSKYLENVSCVRLDPFLPQVPSNLPPSCWNMSYSVTHADLRGLRLLIGYYPAENLGDESVISSFRNLQHLTLHGHDGVHTIEQTVEFAKIWIPKLKCRKLTIQLPQVLNRSRSSTLSTITSLLVSVGPSLTVLHLHVQQADLAEICQFTSLCPNLDLLGIRLLSVSLDNNKTDLHVEPLRRLVSLSFACVCVPCPTAVNVLVEKLIQASPNLTNLELVLAYEPYEWLMGMAVKRSLAGIHTFRLSFNGQEMDVPCFDYYQLRSVDAAYCVTLLNHMPQLQVLMLNVIPLRHFSTIRSLFRTSSLKVVARTVPYIGYSTGVF